MKDPTLREETAAAFVAVAEANLNAAINLTDWPRRHRLKQLTADLSEVRDDHYGWLVGREARKATR